MGHRDYLSLLGCIPGATLAGSWSGEQELEISSMYLDVGQQYLNLKAI